jgi:hypothetical protein
MNIQTTNDFFYLDFIYNKPYFVISYYPIIDAEFTPINCYMFLNKNSFENKEQYLQSFGMDVSNEIIFDNNLIIDKYINFLKTISPSTIFTLD